MRDIGKLTVTSGQALVFAAIKGVQSQFKLSMTEKGTKIEIVIPNYANMKQQQQQQLKRSITEETAPDLPDQ